MLATRDHTTDVVCKRGINGRVFARVRGETKVAHRELQEPTFEGGAPVSVVQWQDLGFVNNRSALATPSSLSDLGLHVCVR